ncbi:DnaJ domain-containing protein [Roseibium aggregatum]|uniref:DnaJ domain-containing protein n=1 Tax=Roseibium aggregatum TaxID=187304 RepID=A0A926NYE8_9HYPH|nr:DnaJ domain-containing protein [Roseibium aggregatum]MBD1545900.1 DnaJ domain-containing protein [Roseibium aggregatum]
MFYLLLGILLLIMLLYAAQHFVQANPADLAKTLRQGAGIALLAIAGIFAVGGRFAFAVPLAGVGLSLLGWKRLGGVFGSGSGQATPGQTSRVRTAMVEMELDHDSGDMSGTVLAGRFTGQSLGDLSDADLKALWEETATDAQSRALVEAYLDRRLSGWREHFKADGAERQGGPASAGAMTDEEAYQILGLSPGAGDAEIRAAHRRLMQRLHPDHGGTTFLAAKLNEAKDTLLRRH